MDTERYLQTFLDEAGEYVQAVGDILLRWDQGQVAEEDFAEVFRAAHTLKGMSATMGFAGLAATTHRLEDVLSVLRDHPEALDQGVVDVLFACLDALESALAEIRAHGSEPSEPPVHVVQRLDEILRRLTGQDSDSEVPAVPASDGTLGLAAAGATSGTVPSEWSEFVKGLQSQGIAVGWLTVKIDPSCLLKGPRAVLVSREVERYADIIQCIPSPEQMEAGAYDQTLQFLVALREPDSAPLLESVKAVAEVVEAGFVPADASAGAADADDASRSAAQSRPAPEQEPSGAAEATVDRQAETPQRGTSGLREATLRVAVDKVDALMRRIGELVIAKNRLLTLLGTREDQELRACAEQVASIVNDLQESITAMRMVPVEGLFRRFPRMVRDLAKQLGKEIRLELEGLDTELDRTVVDEVADVLVHLIRNAADHGIEPPDIRISVGKPRVGTVRLSAYQSGQHVFIDVRDDGAGIDAERVKRRAMERGLLNPVRAAQLRDEDVFDLLFAPGFSTADRVSDISGRGVGLDAVRDRVEALGGTIVVQSRPGQGTTFRVQLPLTLTVLRALLFETQRQVYAVPLSAVDEVAMVDESGIDHVYGRPVFPFRGQLLPIIDTGEWLHDQRSLAEFPWRLVVCRAGDRRIALGVERLLGQQEIANQPAGAYLKDVRWLAGVSTLGDGSIAFIMDVQALVEEGPQLVNDEVATARLGGA